MRDTMLMKMMIRLTLFTISVTPAPGHEGDQMPPRSEQKGGFDLFHPKFNSTETVTLALPARPTISIRLPV
jgi:hypothetical protein